MPVRLLLALICACCLAVDAAAAPPQDEYVRDAVKVAKGLVDSQDIYDQILAAGALAEVGDPAALEFLERCIGHDDIIIKRSAIDTLLSASHPSSIDLLFRVAERNSEVLGHLVESLASTPRADMDDLLLRAMAAPSLHTQKHALQAVARVDARRLHGAILALVSKPETDPMVRAYGYYALVRSESSSEAIAEVMTLSKSKIMQEQEVAAVALGLVNTEASKAALLALSKEEEQRVSLAAIASNAGLGDEDAVAQTIKYIAYGTPMEAAVMAGSLKRMPPDMAFQITEVLLTCCKLKADAATRLLESWGWIASDPTAVYEWGLAHQEADVRLQTLWLIGQRKDARVLGEAAKFLNDEDPALRGMAAWSIMHTLPELYVPGVET